jgi:hypothetical protein
MPTKTAFVGWKGTWNTTVRIGSDKMMSFITGLTIDIAVGSPRMPETV